VFQRLIFCDPWGADLHNIIHRQSREKRFPILSLSREYGIAAAGQLRTRVQAFLERIEISKAGNAGGAS
jgi:benzoyl-CoA reductase/2-hydroxyglutaryl-CoA dehydratase subunit BcrC/BadD/HgdB